MRAEAMQCKQIKQPRGEAMSPNRLPIQNRMRANVRWGRRVKHIHTYIRAAGACACRGLYADAASAGAARRRLASGRVSWIAGPTRSKACPVGDHIHIIGAAAASRPTTPACPAIHRAVHVPRTRRTRRSACPAGWRDRKGRDKSPTCVRSRSQAERGTALSTQCNLVGSTGW